MSAFMEPSKIMKFFSCEHLPSKLRLLANPIKMAAELMDDQLPDCEEKQAGLRKLLEAKDCFVRAGLMEGR